MENLNLGSENAPFLQKVSRDKTGSAHGRQITLSIHTDLSRGLSEVGSPGGPGGFPLVMRRDGGWDSVPHSLHQGIALSEDALRFQPLALSVHSAAFAVSSVEHDSRLLGAFIVIVLDPCEDQTPRSQSPEDVALWTVHTGRKVLEAWVGWGLSEGLLGRVLLRHRHVLESVELLPGARGTGGWRTCP